MTEPKPTYDDNGQSQQVESLLAARQHAIGLILVTERLLESSGYPVESAIVTRRERRSLTIRTRKRNI